MQCPKCGHEPTLKEIQAEPDICTSCGASYNDVTPQVKEPNTHDQTLMRTGYRKYLLIGVVSILIVAVVCVIGVREYAHYQLVRNVDSVLRQANGQIAELVDEKANRTNADFLRVYQARLDGLDALVANALAINDSSSPGISSATADYVRASREFLKVVAREVGCRINISLKVSAFNSAKEYLNDEVTAKFVGLSDYQVNALLKESVDRVSSEGDLSKSLDLLKQATIYEGLAKRRRAYLTAESELNDAETAHKTALTDMAKAGAEIQRVGSILEEKTGEKLPIQAWKLRG